MRWLCNMDGKDIRNVYAAFRFCDVLGSLAQGFKRNGVQFAVLNAGEAAGPPCGDVVLFFIN